MKSRFHHTAGPVAVVWVATASCACSSSVSPNQERNDANQGQDGRAKADTGQNRQKDAALSDTSSADGAICPESLSDLCMAHGGCVMNWPPDITAFCQHFGPTDTWSMNGCGSYRGVSDTNVDVAIHYYYNISTGKLTAVFGHNYKFSSAQCLGGPPDFVEPQCDTTTPVDCTSDAANGAGGGSGAGGQGGASGARDAAKD